MVNTDRTTLITTRQTSEEFIENMCTEITRLTRHHCIAKSQGAHLRNLKSELKTHECILCGDFSEKYSFVIKDHPGIPLGHGTGNGAPVCGVCEAE